MIDSPYKLPSGWRWARLGEVCQINPRRPRINRAEEAATSFIPMNAVDEREGAITELQARPFGQVKKGYTSFEEGDVLFAKITPCMQNGKATIASGLIGRVGYGSTEFHVLRPGQDLIAKWALFFVRQECFRQEATKTFRGAVGQQRVPQEFLEAYPVPLPSLAEQRRIVTRVEGLMERVREAKRLRSDTVGEAERLTASALGEELARLYSLHPCQTIHELRANGKLEILGGGTPSKKNKAFWEGDVPWVSPKDMKCWVIADTEDHISSEAINASSTKMMRAGAVLVVVRGMILARRWPIAIAGIYLTINQDMKALLPRDGILSEYLGYLLRSLEPQVLDQIETAAHGTRRLKSNTLEALRIPIAPITEQQRLVAYLDSVQAQATALKRAQEDTDADLRRLEQAILDRAFRGEL